MKFSALIIAAVMVFGVSAQLSGPNGGRICVGGAISCECK